MSETAGLLLAHGFGWFYNWLVAYCQGRPMWRMPMGVWVALGCTALLALSAAVSDGASLRMAFYWRGEVLRLSNHQHAALYEVKFFVAGGLPMVLGSLWRDLNGPGR